MKTKQLALDALKYVFTHPNNQDAFNEMMVRTAKAIEVLEADIAQPVEPYGYVRRSDDKFFSHPDSAVYASFSGDGPGRLVTVYTTQQEPAAQFKGPAKLAPEEVAIGNAGIRWVNEEGVQGRPTDHDVREFLQCTPTAIGCHCEKCLEFYKPAAPEWIAVSKELLDRSMPDCLHSRLWIATNKYGVMAGRYEWRQGRYPHCFFADTGELYGIDLVTHIMPYSAPQPPKETP